MITIIVPVYNAENNLKKCLESIINQTYRELEIILIDDGSKDRSAAICREYERMDPRISFYQQKNQGVSYTRNKGIRLAKGNYIQFVDSDDYLELFMCERMVNTIENDNSDMVICGFYEYSSEILKDIRLPDIEGRVMLSSLKMLYPNVFEKFLLNAPWNKLYRKEKITEEFQKDVSLGEDLIFNLHNISQNMQTISFIKAPLYHYIVHEGGLNTKYRSDSIVCAERIYEESIKFSRQYELGKMAEEDISRIFIEFLFYGLSDLFRLSGYNKNELKKTVRNWIYNANVQRAVIFTKFSRIDKKIALLCVKYKMCASLSFIFSLKSKVRKYL